MPFNCEASQFVDIPLDPVDYDAYNLYKHAYNTKTSRYCDWWFWYENWYQCLSIEIKSITSDSDIGPPILALKYHLRPKKAIKAKEGQRKLKKSKTCNSIINQYSRLNNQLMPMCQ